MTGSDDHPCSDSDYAIERGETYDHAEHGLIEVTEIFRGVTRIKRISPTNGTETVIVLYSTEQDDERDPEFVKPLGDFLEAVE